MNGSRLERSPRMKTSLYLGIAARLSALTLSCATADSAGPRTAPLAGDHPEAKVTLRLVDVMISPTRLDGKPWDQPTG